MSPSTSRTTFNAFPYTLNFLTVLCTLLFVLESKVLRVHAGLFIVEPHAGSTCQAGVPCTVSWVDDGMRPLFSAIGVSTVGLYTGRQQLVQRIAPVDVTKQTSLTFTPLAGAGPNSDTYYIAITSTTARGVNDSTILYSGWSPNFRLTGMSGSFEAPLAAATKDIPIPGSLTRSASTQSTTLTITIGAISTLSLTPTTPSLANPTGSSSGGGAGSGSSQTASASASRSTGVSGGSSSSSTGTRLTTSILSSSSPIISSSGSGSSSASVTNSATSAPLNSSSSSSSSSSNSGNSTIPSGASRTKSTLSGLTSVLVLMAMGALGLLL